MPVSGAARNSARIPQCPSPDPPSRPPARRGCVHRGDERIDPWFWLRDRDDPEVIAYLEAENTYTERRARAPRRRCATSSTTRSSDASRRPTRRRRSVAATRVLHPHRRRPAVRRALPAPAIGGPLPDPLAAPGPPGDELVVLDENVLAAGHDYFALGDLARRPDADLAAYTHRHDRRRALRRCASATLDGERRGPELDDVVPDVYYGLAWANDNATILYTRPDEAMRPWQVWRHTLGTPTDDDVLVFQEDDERFYVSRRPHPQRPLLVITVGLEDDHARSGWSTPTTPTAPPAVVEPRDRASSTTSSTTRAPAGDRLFVLTNADGAENFTLGHAGRRTGPRLVDDRRSRTGPTSASTTSTRSPDILVVSERADGRRAAPRPDPRRRRRGGRRPRDRDARRGVLGVAGRRTPSSTSTPSATGTRRW